jgi:hypothetical protein
MSGKHQDRGLVGQQFSSHVPATRPAPGLADDPQRRIRAPQPPQQRVRPHRDDQRELLFVGRRCVGFGEHSLGVGELAQLVQRLAEHQLRLDPLGNGRKLGQRRAGQPGGLREVVAVAGQPGRPQQQPGLGGAGGVQPPGGNPQRILPPSCPVPLHPGDLLKQQPTPRRHGHPCPQHLPIQRMRQADQVPPPLDADLDQSGPFQPLGDGEAHQLLDLGQSERLGQRQQLQHRRRRLIGRAQAGRDQLRKPGRAMQGPGQPPHSAILDKAPGRLRAQHQLPH